jgi:hypothetical protein
MIPAANAIVIVNFIIVVVMDDSFMKVTIIITTTTVIVIPFGISIDIAIAFVRLTLTPMSSRMSTGIAAAAASTTNIIIVVGRRRGEWQSTKRGPSQHYRHDVDY